MNPQGVRVLEVELGGGAQEPAGQDDGARIDGRLAQVGFVEQIEVGPREVLVP